MNGKKKLKEREKERFLPGVNVSERNERVYYRC